jgi:hypothetical protein
VQFLPSTPQKLPICQTEGAKAPELRIKAERPSRAATLEERAGFSHSVKEHTCEVSGRVGSRHSWRLDRYLVSDEPPLDYALSQKNESDGTPTFRHVVLRLRSAQTKP